MAQGTTEKENPKPLYARPIFFLTKTFKEINSNFFLKPILQQGSTKKKIESMPLYDSIIYTVPIAFIYYGLKRGQKMEWILID